MCHIPVTYPIPECYERQESKNLTHCINEETEAQRGKVTGSMSPSYRRRSGVRTQFSVTSEVEVYVTVQSSDSGGRNTEVSASKNVQPI